jgi:hypothetical protein
MPLDARAILRAIVSPVTGRMDQGRHIPCDQSSSAPVKGIGHFRSPRSCTASVRLMHRVLSKPVYVRKMLLLAGLE